MTQREFTEREEGKRYKAYMCSAGKLTLMLISDMHGL